MFVASAAVAAAAPAADKKAREFPEILSEGLIAIIIVEWVGVATAPWGEDRAPPRGWVSFGLAGG